MQRVHGQYVEIFRGIRSRSSPQNDDPSCQKQSDFPQQKKRSTDLLRQKRNPTSKKHGVIKNKDKKSQSIKYL